ncbi:hypothetical protein ABIE35_001025 [Paenarthrobacter sp. 4246]
MRLVDALIPANSVIRARGWLTHTDGRTWFTHRVPQSTGGATTGVEVLGSFQFAQDESITHGELHARWEQGALAVMSWTEGPPATDSIVGDAARLATHLGTLHRGPSRTLNTAEQEACEATIQGLFNDGRIVSRSVLTVPPGSKVTVIATQVPAEVEELLGSYFEPGYLYLVRASWTATDLLEARNALAGLPEGLVLSTGQGLNARGETPLRVTLFAASPEFDAVQHASPPGLIVGEIWFQQ